MSDIRELEKELLKAYEEQVSDMRKYIVLLKAENAKLEQTNGELWQRHRELLAALKHESSKAKA
jgi:hypothetical protein